MTDGLCEETQPCFILAVLFALHGADATRTDCRDVEMPLRKGKEMTAIKVGSPTKIETLISRMKQSGGSTETVLANEAAAELASLRAESEARRVALEQKAEEVRREWTRAENAEAALEQAREILSIVSAENGSNSADAYLWLQKYGDK